MRKINSHGVAGHGDRLVVVEGHTAETNFELNPANMTPHQELVVKVDGNGGRYPVRLIGLIDGRQVTLDTPHACIRVVSDGSKVYRIGGTDGTSSPLPVATADPLAMLLAGAGDSPDEITD